ncbi:MAG: glycosyltransferase family 39 protein [Candidatus Omnitrophica bacterium]|nr:glycosyltransferase family 39 protein [Candidatus Omnitrophota bacterium]
MALKDKAKNYLMPLWIGLAAAYILLILPRMSKPILGWEAMVCWQIPREIAAHGYAAVKFFKLPPLYDSLIAASFKIFGISEISARLTGMICFLIMPVMIYLLVKEMTEEKDTLPVAFIASAIFCTAPLIIQGSLLIDRSDTTILTFALTLFYLALLKTEGRPLAYRVASLGALYAVCLWVKVTTPLACLAAVPLAYILCGRIKYGILFSLGVFISGITLFAITWGAFCFFLVGMSRFFEPLGYYGAAASGTVLALKSGLLTRIILDLFRVYLWFSPLLLMLGALAAFTVFKRLLREPAAAIKDTQLLIFIGVVAAGYLYTNATFSGFPKYVAPVMPMLACVIAKFVWEKIGKGFGGKELFLIALSFSAGVAYYIMFVKDWVYVVYALRQAQSVGMAGSAIPGAIYQQALYLLFPAVVFFLSLLMIPGPLIKKLALVLFVCLVAGNVALDIMQRNAAYAVNFGYGTEGAEELRAFLKAKQPTDVFSSIEGYVANVGDVRFRGIDADVWNDPGKFLAFMKRYGPECLIYGLGVNTASQIRGTMDIQAVRAYLKNGYDSRAIGSYNILLKRGDH